MEITKVDGYILVDYLPIGKTMFDYHIRKTSKCSKVIDKSVKWKEKLICDGFEAFLRTRKDIGKTIDVMIQEKDENGNYFDVFKRPSACEIKDYGLAIKEREKLWFEETFVYSYITYVSRPNFTDNPLNTKQDDVIYTVLYEKSGHTYTPKKYCDIAVPMEIVEILWDEQRQIMLIRPYICFTPENALEKIGEKGVKELLKYLYTNINTLKFGDKTDAPDSLKKRFSFFRKCFPWMTAEEYSMLSEKEKRGVPGIYTLYDTNCDEDIYYTGKTIDMYTRVVAPQFKNGETCTVGHPKEDKEFRQFSHVRFDAFQFSQFLEFCNIYQKEIKDKEEHKAEDAAFTEQVLYAIEGVVNHIVRMALEKQPQAKSVNTQFEPVTKQALVERKNTKNP